ncbi:MAG: hypothetical protein H6523_12855 [Mycolicibacterium sp.]|nr:hypothetical protein [Mycolicibacterium sp.]
MTTETRVSRILIFVSEPDLQATVAAIAAAADTEPSWGEVTRSDGTTAPRARIDLDATVIEVSGGDPEVPTVLELTVDDEQAAAERAAGASGFAAKATMLGWRVRCGDAFTLALRAAE